MGTWCSQPNWSAYLSDIWGLGGDEFAFGPASLSGIVVGTNPPWNLANFFALQPVFAGPQLAITGDLTGGTTVVTNTNTTGLQIGQPVLRPDGQLVPPGTLIQSVDSPTQFTMSSVVLASQSAASLNIVNAPVVPPVVVNAYIAIATASLMQQKWHEMWPMAMALYVAHFCTLFLQSNGVITSNPGQVAAAGLARGILVSKSGGPVSGSYQVTPGLEDWGSWNETQFGKQLATFAKVVGAGPAYCR